MTSGTSSAVRKLLKVLVLIGVVALPFEIMSYVAGKYLAGLSLLYDPPQIENYASYLKNRDPVLGWPIRANFGRGEYDRSEERG